MTSGLAVEGLVKTYTTQAGEVSAVDDVSFNVEAGSFFTLLGPSGCGKTTTLRCVAGLERASAGSINIEGRTVMSCTSKLFVPPNQRDIGMVFQSYAIWPHMSVFDNVSYPLRMKRPRVPKSDIRKRVLEALDVVQLAGLENRMATQLSGGQQQRLALARALVRQPSLLLLDEPLSNLDAKLREELRSELRDLQRRIGVTTLYVTHDQAEALSMSTRIAVMSNGRVVQEATPAEIYMRPATRFVAAFVGATNFLPAEVIGMEGDICQLRTAAGVLKAQCRTAVKAAQKVTVAIRPENVVVGEAQTENRLEGIVEKVLFLGEYIDCRVKAGGSTLMIRQHPSAGVEVGQSITVGLPVESLTVMVEDGASTEPAQHIERANSGGRAT